jgi:hypothetical protein
MIWKTLYFLILFAFTTFSEYSLCVSQEKDGWFLYRKDGTKIIEKIQCSLTAPSPMFPEGYYKASFLDTTWSLDRLGLRVIGTVYRTQISCIPKDEKLYTSRSPAKIDSVKTTSKTEYLAKSQE